MLKIYLQQGVKIMLQYWPILVFYQALILCILVVYYFMIQSALKETDWVKVKIEYMDRHVELFDFIGLKSQER